MAISGHGGMDPKTYAWNYFALHAAQRMGIFQFFISLCTAIVGGAVLIAGSASDRKWSAILFMLLPLLAFVFLRLDKRTSRLIKNAEAALISLEGPDPTSNSDEALNPLALFANDKRREGAERKGLLTGHLSYSQSFLYVFIATALLGLVGASIVFLSSEPKTGPLCGRLGEITQIKLVKKYVGVQTPPSNHKIDLPKGTPFTLEVDQAASIQKAGARRKSNDR